MTATSQPYEALVWDSVPYCPLLPSGSEPAKLLQSSSSYFRHVHRQGLVSLSKAQEQSEEAKDELDQLEMELKALTREKESLNARHTRLKGRLV